MVFVMRFTRDEFDTMVDELLFKEPISFDMLCIIVEKTLRPTVINWCKKEECLCGRSYEDDIMQDIHLRLIKTTVDYFLLRDGIVGSYNDDPEGFEDWIFRVADNIKRDYANRVRNMDFKNINIDVREFGGDPSSDPDEYKIEKLSKAFSIVLSSEVSVYKILTWLAHFVFILNNNISKIKSNDLIIESFENKTLYEMYEVILRTSKNIPWFVVSEDQNKKILNALRKNRGDGVLYGETKYSDFFMIHNGEISGKKSISDWMNRMNDMIKRKYNQGSVTMESTSKNSDKNTNKKRGSNNEASEC